MWPQVLHVRNMPPDATEADVLELCRPFGRIIRIKLTGGAQKNQVLLSSVDVGWSGSNQSHAPHKQKGLGQCQVGTIAA